MGGVISVQVETADADPLGAPHRISDEPTKDQADVVLSYDGDAPCVGLVMSTGPTPSSGATLLFVGGACSEQLTCTEERACSAGPSFAPGSTWNETITHAELAALVGDGDVTVYAHAQVEAQGWT